MHSAVKLGWLQASMLGVCNYVGWSTWEMTNNAVQMMQASRHARETAFITASVQSRASSMA
jgi:hypothetical protein